MAHLTSTARYTGPVSPHIYQKTASYLLFPTFVSHVNINDTINNRQGDVPSYLSPTLFLTVYQYLHENQHVMNVIVHHVVQ